MKVGDKATFKPAGFIEYDPALPGIPITVTGRIAEITRAHRWFRVVFTVHNKTTMNECFKF